MRQNYEYPMNLYFVHIAEKLDKIRPCGCHFGSQLSKQI